MIMTAGDVREDQGPDTTTIHGEEYTHKRLIYFVSAAFYLFKAGVSDADLDHGGSQRGGSEGCQGPAEGQRAKGSPAGVHGGRGEVIYLYALYNVFNLNRVPF